MKSDYKKPLLFGLGFLFCIGLLVSARPAQALSKSVRQVRTAEDPAVYYLYHAGHRKKAYLNAETYLGYGNKWSDVRVITADELADWPEAKLLKKASEPTVYYIKGALKTPINSWSDLEDFGLSYEPIIMASQTDLDQYETRDYASLGLIKTNGIVIFNDLITAPNKNTLLTTTDGNLMAIFRFRSQSRASITAMTVNFTGLFGGPLLQSGFVLDEHDSPYDAQVSVSSARSEMVITFREPLVISQGEEKSLKIFLDLAACSCDNQTIRAELSASSSIVSDVPVTAAWPVRGTEFKLLNGANFLAQPLCQKQTLNGISGNAPVGSRLIGKFNLTEQTGREDLTVKNLIFRNRGTAGKNDWEDFRLYSNGNLIARSQELNANHDIEFKINYLKVKKSAPAVLTVVAALKADHDPAATYDLEVRSLWAVGSVYNASLSPQVYGLSEPHNLN